MANKEINPMTERKIPLTDDQYKQISNALRSPKVQKQILASLIKEMAQEILSEQEDAWDCISRLAGVDVKDRSKTVEVDWINRCIIVKGKSEQENGYDQTEDRD